MADSKAPALGNVMKEGLWGQNVVFSQLLAMCPTMAVTTSGTNGLGMGLATTAVLIVSNILVSMIRHTVSSQVRIPVFVVVIAGLVTVVDCAILGRAEAFAVKNGVLISAVDGLAMGLGFTGALTFVGLLREFFGAGTLFSNASNLLGPSFAFLEMKLPGYGGALLMILPPGGFAVLGFILAGKRAMELRQARLAKAAPPPAAQPSHC
jgi:electron transport complex protein RnfE